MYSLILLLTSIGDRSASLNTHAAEIDKRLQEALLMEDPDLLVDLRALNLKQRNKYNVLKADYEGGFKWPARRENWQPSKYSRICGDHFVSG